MNPSSLQFSPACDGHECDLCGVCRQGRCCRRDRPGYRLPALGSIMPFHGDLGVRRTDGTRIECHVCGVWYRALGPHIWQAHDLWVAEYREAFGLSGKGLCGEATTERHSAYARRLFREGKIGRNWPAVPTVTREQHQAARQSLERSMQARATAMTTLATGHDREAVKKMAATKRRKSAAMRLTLRCGICGESFSVLPHRRRATCGRDECRRALLRGKALSPERVAISRGNLRRAVAAVAAMWADPERKAALLRARGPAHESRRRRIERQCAACGASFETIPSRADQAACSVACATERRRGRPGRPLSDASRARIAAAKREWWATRRAPEVRT